MTAPFGPIGLNPSDGRAAALLNLAGRVRTLAPDLQTAIYRVGQLAGPDTWQGRVADVFWDELFDEAARLGRMGDELDLVARRLEAQAFEVQALEVQAQSNVVPGAVGGAPG